MAECAGSHGAVWHDGGLVHVLHVALKACVCRFWVFVIFRIIQLGSGDQKTVSQPSNDKHSDQCHEAEKISLPCLLFGHEISESLKLFPQVGFIPRY